MFVIEWYRGPDTSNVFLTYSQRDAEAIVDDVWANVAGVTLIVITGPF